MDRIIFMSATDLADGIRRRQFSAVEVFEAHLQQVARHNPKLNALVTIDEEGGRRQAREADEALARGEVWGPLHGVPITLKDVWETAGLRTTAGSPRLKDHIPQADATVAARLKAAGAILYAKSNLPEMAMDIQTDNALFGRTNNPWDLARTPGGSTGGGAAALAAGLSALEVGSDLGGSIRIPAHFCGLFGLKTTHQRLSMAGHIPPLPGGRPGGLLGSMVSAGPLARSVADLRLALSLLAGPDRRSVDLPPVACDPVAEKPWSEYRIAWCDELGAPVGHETRTAVAHLVSDLEKLGSQVVHARPDLFGLDDLMETYGELLGAGLASKGFRPPLPGFLFKLLAGSAKGMARGYLNGMGATLDDYARFTERHAAAVQVLERFFYGGGSRRGDDNRPLDAWIIPVTAMPAFPHRAFKNQAARSRVTVDVDGMPVDFFTAVQGLCVPFNLTGSPAVVIPIGLSASGLPIGAQMVGPRWSEMHLLALAEKISREITGPFCPPPGY